ncbi:MAG: HlyD family efflux transporter periplasmic adaptor subunit [Alistipes sp.]|nr:HlyD family efflux transporter periplasmic adaptor subunit [Alistipes sp.]
MDRVIEKKKGINKKHIPYIAGGVALAAAVCWIVFNSGTSRMNVEQKRLTIAQAVSGEFNDYIRVTGQVQPISTIQLSAVEGGMVAEKVVEEGSMVKAGDVIVRLTSSQLNLSILSAEADLAEKENILRPTQLNMDQDRLNVMNQRLQYEMETSRSKRKYEQYENLYRDNLVSREDYLQAKEDYDFQREALRIVMERQVQDSLMRSIQLSQLRESLASMQTQMALIRQKVEDLNIKAPVDGQLGLPDVELGENIAPGAKIGQINVLSDYKVEGMIDEHFIDRVNTDLAATFERQDRNFQLRVRKVFPEVREKQFKTEFVFEGERPDNIRAGQTYYINLQLGQPTEAVMIPRGTFYQTTGGKWIYVVSPDGSRATRRNITIGRQNPLYYEVLSGLEQGEQVIISGYDSFGDTQELILK